MANMQSVKGKGKARTVVVEVASSSTVAPPRTPHRNPQPPDSTPTSAQPAILATPSSSSFLSTPSSKRKSQARITSFFPNKKVRIETIPFELSPAEKKAKKEEEDDIKALIKDIEKEERELKKAEREAERQLKREEKLAASEERRRKAQHRLDWNSWCDRNSRPDATFKIPKGDVWAMHKCMSQCVQEFGLRRSEVLCLEHCSIPNYHDKDAADIRLYRSDDVEKLAGRKEAMLAGIECSDEEELIAKGWALFTQKQLAKAAGRPAAPTQS